MLSNLDTPYREAIWQKTFQAELKALKAAGIYSHFIIALGGTTAQRLRCLMPRYTAEWRLPGKHAGFFPP